MVALRLLPSLVPPPLSSSLSLLWLFFQHMQQEGRKKDSAAAKVPVAAAAVRKAEKSRAAAHHDDFIDLRCCCCCRCCSGCRFGPRELLLSLATGNKRRNFFNCPAVTNRCFPPMKGRRKTKREEEEAHLTLDSALCSTSVSTASSNYVMSSYHCAVFVSAVSDGIAGQEATKTIIMAAYIRYIVR